MSAPRLAIGRPENFPSEGLGARANRQDFTLLSKHGLGCLGARQVMRTGLLVVSSGPAAASTCNQQMHMYVAVKQCHTA